MQYVLEINSWHYFPVRNLSASVFDDFIAPKFTEYYLPFPDKKRRYIQCDSIAYNHCGIALGLELQMNWYFGLNAQNLPSEFPTKRDLDQSSNLNFA